MGGAKDVLAISLKYAKERKAFGSAIAEFGAIEHKLAEMAIRIYAAESMAWRLVGLIQGQLYGFSWEQPDASKTMLKAIEEYAAECSMVKVYGSEALDYVVDEGVQIHGGYGFHQDYEVERAYRDSRINRIFEGTNEINRLLITGMLLKRAARGQLSLVPAVQTLMRELQGGSVAGQATDEEMRLLPECQKDCPFDDWACVPEVSGRSREAAGDFDESRGHHHRSFRDGIEPAPHQETGWAKAGCS